jgi:AraC-like DNA-binding protein
VQVTIDWIQLAQLVGALQGVFLALVLVAHRTNRAANRLLAALMIAFAVGLVSEVYYSAGIIRSHPHFFGISYPLPWIFGPLVYLYTLAASDRTWRFRARGAMHFAPAAMVVVLTFPIYLRSGPEKIALYDQLTSGNPPALLAVLDPFKYVSGLAYCGVTLAYLRAHRRRVEDSYSNTDRVNLRWLQSLAGVAAAIWVLAVVTDISGLFPQLAEPRRGSLVSLAIAIFVYAIGYKGLKQPEIFRYDRLDSTDAPAGESRVAAEAPAPPVDASAPETTVRYERSGLGELEARRLRATLVAAKTNDHAYRDPDLTLPGLAERVGSTPHKLSEVLNGELSRTFYDFVNGYRVEEVCRRLADPESRNLNMLALGMDAGFASKSTFNQAFKKVTGQTPSSYRKALEARRSLAG